MADTLNVYDNTESRTPVVICFEPGIARREGDPSRFVEDISPTIRATMGDNKPAVCYPIEGNGARPSHMGAGFSEDDVMFTLNTSEKHAVCYAIDSHPEDSRFKLEGTVTPTVTAKIAKGSADGPLVLIENEVSHDREPSGGPQGEV